MNVGAVFNSITTKQIGNIIIPLPPLSEQKRIVAILDQAFDAIDKAKANIQKNIQNAKELFQSKLNEVFSQKGDGWVEKKFHELFKLKSGDGLTTKKMIKGSFPVYGGNGIVGYHNEYNMDGNFLIIGRVGALCGNIRHVESKFWLTDNAFQISKMNAQFDYNFLCYLLNSKNLKSYARQAAQPVISNSSLKNVIINYPTDVKYQENTSSLLNNLENKSNELNITYEKKLKTLDELKKSLLQKAFTGELTS